MTLLRWTAVVVLLGCRAVQPSVTPPPGWVTTCGDARCQEQESCLTCAMDCGTCRGLCDRAADGWIGCRANGCSVCAEAVADYPRYFFNHPACKKEQGCGGRGAECSSNCPPPSPKDR